MSPTAANWGEVSLGDVCEFKYGKSLPDAKRRGGPFPVFGSNGVVGFHDESITSGPTIIVGRKGSFGEVTFSPLPCWPIDTTYYVDSTSTKADLRWLAYRLSDLGLTALNRAAAVPGLNREDAYRQRLLLPSLSEQRRIADILDRAEYLRCVRRQSLAHVDALAESLFLDMFGAPSPAWPIATVGDLGTGPDAIRTGPFGSQLLHSEFVPAGIAVLGIDNAVTNEFRRGGERFITSEKYKSLRRYTVKPRDVLITIMGTCGRCAIVPDDIPITINTKHLCCITLNHDMCLPEYLHAYFLRHPAARTYLEKAAKGAIMSGLNMSIIKSMPIPLPPMALQEEFVELLGHIHQLGRVLRSSGAALDSLFASVQSRGFGGDL